MSQLALSRQELHALVWSRPMAHVAKDLGLSDRGLAKVCARHEIPVPPRGYWARKSHGQAVQPVALPKASRGGLDHIEVGCAPPEQAVTAIVLPEVAFEQDPANRIVVPPRLGRSHPYIRRTREALKRQKPGDRGLLFPTGRCLDVRVSREQVSRALRLMNTLVLAMEDRGWNPQLPREGRGLQVNVLGEQLVVSITERAKQVPRRARDWEQRDMEEGRRRSGPYDLVPAGVLILRIHNATWQLCEFLDRLNAPLEGRLNEFLICLVETAVAERDQRAERERRAREEAERQRVQWAQEERERQWNEWMDAWDKSQRIRAFAAAVAGAFAPVEPGSKIDEWLAFAADYAERNDPLREARKAPNGR